MAIDTALCLCGGQQPVAHTDTQWAKGCYMRLGQKRAMKIAAQARADKALAAAVVFRCFLHPEWRADNKADRDRHFKAHRLTVEKPKLEPQPCACNCGALAKPGNRFIHGHAARVQSPETRAKIAASKRAAVAAA